MQETTKAVAAQPQKQNPVTNFEAIVKSNFIDAQLTSALRENKGAFVASLVELYTGDKSLQTCNPKHVALEAVKAASLNLPINKSFGFAYIVVYNNNVKVRDEQGRDIWQKVPTPTFILGYKGYVQLAMRTGQYRTINADVVYEGEVGRVDRLSGEVWLDGRRTSDKVVGYFAYIELLNGFRKTLYMTVAEMAAYARRYSPSIPRNVTVEQLINKANDGIVSKQVGWMGNFTDMAIKTVIRRLLSKYGFLSVEMLKAAQGEAEMDDAAAAERNDIIAANANIVEIKETDSYEAVDTATGEVLEQKPEAAAEEDEQPY